MRYTPTFESFTSDDMISINRVNYLKKKKPVLFLNFSFECEDMYNNEYNVEQIMNKYIDFADYSDITQIHYFNGDVYNGVTKLDEYSLVFAWTPHKNKYENFMLVRDYCTIKKIPFIPQGNNSNPNNKYQQLLALHNEGIKIPKTYAFTRDNCDIDLVSKEFSYPLILKAAYGSRGINVVIIKSESELIREVQKIKQDALLIQEFIPNDCDYRVMFIGNKHVFNVKRTRDKKDEKEFRNNIALGAKGENVKLGVEAMNLAERAHKSMGFYTSGVDLIQNKETMEWSVLEVNSTPDFSIFGPESVIKIFAADINARR
jgi:glutathione synthase/RimK-type ligase-like ATP-grasp enzyme